jgi:serine phosphatase RsbU (regulator of sigma subunit)
MREPACRFQLQVTVGSRRLDEVALGRGHLSIGRSPRAGLTIDDPFASRLHAEIWHDGEACWLSDLGSSNGTYLNGDRVSGAVQVLAGDSVRIGETTLTLALADEPARPPTAPQPMPPGVDRSGAELSALLASVQRATGLAPASGLGAATTGAPPRDLFALVSKVGVALLSPSGLDEVLAAILALVFDGIPAERAFLLLGAGGEEEPELKAASYREGARGAGDQARISREVQRQVLVERRSILTTDAQVDERFRLRDSVILSGVRSIMAVPLLHGEQVLGMVYVDSPLEVRPFTHADLQVLTTIAGVAAIKVENAMLLEQRIENERLHKELQKAREIQLRLLPSQPPQQEGYQLSGVSFPSQAVGGDYFDFIPTESGVLLAVGDVSGKGLDAALAMSSLHACVRAQARAGRALADLVREVNGYLVEHLPFNKFATLFCCLLDPRTHTLSFVNAGHNPPLLVRHDGEVRELEATGMPAGLAMDADYALVSVDFGPGDLLVAFTDGVTEASPEGLGGEPLGSDGLARLVVPLRHLSARELLDRLDELLIEHMGGREADDDVTLVVARRAPC